MLFKLLLFAESGWSWSDRNPTNAFHVVDHKAQGKLGCFCLTEKLAGYHHRVCWSMLFIPSCRFLSWYFRTIITAGQYFEVLTVGSLSTPPAPGMIASQDLGQFQRIFYDYESFLRAFSQRDMCFMSGRCTFWTVLMRVPSRIGSLKVSQLPGPQVCLLIFTIFFGHCLTTKDLAVVIANLIVKGLLEVLVWLDVFERRLFHK